MWVHDSGCIADATHTYMLYPNKRYYVWRFEVVKLSGPSRYAASLLSREGNMMVKIQDYIGSF
jgi:hypothetical protein